MKICFLTDDPAALGGGPEHMRKVAGLLGREYHYQVDVVTPLTLNPRFNLNSLWQRIYFTLHLPWFLLFSNYDIYHSHSYATSLFLPLAKLQGRKIGVTVHGIGMDVIGGGLLNKIGIFKFLMWLVLNVWPYDYRLSAGKLPGYIQVGNGVDVEEFDREKSKPNPKYFTILCVSRRDPVKGIDILERAVEIVQKGYPQVRLNLVSGRKRMAKDFKTANLYVLPSLSEGFPIVLLEAMAAKLPVVTTDVGDCKELVEKSGTGLVVKPGKIETLVVSIIRIIRTKEKERKKMGENGYNFVRENFSWEKVAERVAGAYEE